MGNMKNKDFQTIKNEYTKAREKEKRKIIDALKENKKLAFLTVENKVTNYPYKTGSGDINYTNRSTIKPYDLSNWKWISVRAEELGVDFLVSLQAFDVDEDSKNTHVLMDRIGLYIHKKDRYNPKECFKNMINTGIDLPMNEEKLEKLKELIDTEIEKFRSR